MTTIEQELEQAKEDLAMAKDMIGDAIMAAGYDHGNEDNNLAKDGELHTIGEAWSAILSTLRAIR